MRRGVITSSIAQQLNQNVTDQLTLKISARRGCVDIVLRARVRRLNISISLALADFAIKPSALSMRFGALEPPPAAGRDKSKLRIELRASARAREIKTLTTRVTTTATSVTGKRAPNERKHHKSGPRCQLQRDSEAALSSAGPHSNCSRNHLL